MRFAIFERMKNTSFEPTVHPCEAKPMMFASSWRVRSLRVLATILPGVDSGESHGRILALGRGRAVE
jgi:hypothetical protein